MTCMLWFHGVNELSFLLMISEAHRISERFVGKLDTRRNHLKPLRNTKRVKLQRFLCREGFYQLGTVWFHLSKWGEEPQHGFYYISTDILELLLGRPGPHGVLCQKQIMSPHPSTTAEKPSLVEMHLGLTNNAPDAVNCATSPETPSEASCRSQQVEGNGVPSCTGFFEFLAHEILGKNLRWNERKQQETTRIPWLVVLLKMVNNTSTAILRGHDVFKIHNGSIWDGRLDGFVGFGAAMSPSCWNGTDQVIVTHSGIVVSAAIGFAALFLVASNGMRWTGVASSFWNFVPMSRYKCIAV